MVKKSFRIDFVFEKDKMNCVRCGAVSDKIFSNTTSLNSITTLYTFRCYMISDKCPNPVGRVLRHGKFYNVACKAWKCPICSRVKKLKLMRRFEHHKGGFRYRMLTLTELKSPENYLNSLNLTQHWNRLRASLRKHGVLLRDYIWVKEYKPLYDDNSWIERMMLKYDALEPAVARKYITDNYDRERSHYDRDWPDGETVLLYPHMHVCVPAYIQVELIRRLWFLATNQTADQVHIPDDENLPNNPIAYMTKYIMKSSMMVGFRKNERRYGCSRKYPAAELPYTYEYELKGETVTGSFEPFHDDGDLIFVHQKWKIPDEVLIFNEKRMGGNYGVAKIEAKALRIWLNKFQQLKYDGKYDEDYDEKYYEDNLNALNELEYFMRLY